MRSFTDDSGRRWDLRLNVASIRDVRDRTGVDLLKFADDEFRAIRELLADLPKLCDVLWVLVERQAAELGMSDRQFGESLSGDVIERGADAFVEELIDFFPNARVRECLTRAIATAKEIRGHLLDIAEQRLAELNPQELAKTIVEQPPDSKS